jgi:hypothetical protein
MHYACAPIAANPRPYLRSCVMNALAGAAFPMMGTMMGGMLYRSSSPAHAQCDQPNLPVAGSLRVALILGG